jgi:hypothetical protein
LIKVFLAFEPEIFMAGGLWLGIDPRRKANSLKLAEVKNWASL